MTQVIPAINVQDFEAFKKQVLIAKDFLAANSWIHIDVVDGRFSPAVTWGDPMEFQTFLSKNISFIKLNFEIHLMVRNPELVSGNWFEAGAKRIIAHEEALIDADVIFEQCQHYQTEAMIAVNPETPVEKLNPFFNQFHYFQILAVKPGWAGQKFDLQVINKVKVLRAQAPYAKIEVDGGINPETARLCKDAGADLFVSASYIFGAKPPGLAYKELVTAVQ